MPLAGPTPLLLKISPDLSLAELDDVVGIARKRRVDGMIVGNTTLARPASVRERDRASEQGGLSGRPLFRLSTCMLAETFVRAEGAFALVGAGGIDSGATAIAKIKAGASLLQLYTGSGVSRRRAGRGNKIRPAGGAQARPSRFACLDGRLGCRQHHRRELAVLSYTPVICRAAR